MSGSAHGHVAGVVPVVLFDFDGVLLRGDAFKLLIQNRLRRGWWRGLLVAASLPGLAAISWSRRGRLAVGRWLARIALLGLDAPRYQELAQGFACRLARHSRRVSPMGIASLRRHLRAGSRVLIVSGCEEHLLRALLAELGITGVAVVASRLARCAGGMRVAWHNVGPRKLESLACCGIDSWQLAYSDSCHDLPMLMCATEPVLVNASPRERRRVEKALGRHVTRVEWR